MLNSVTLSKESGHKNMDTVDLQPQTYEPLYAINKYIKRHTQAKIIKKSVFLFRLNMTIRCDNVHRLKLRKSFKFWAGGAT